MLNKSFSVSISNQIKSYNKTIKVDSDKSISIRSFLIGAVSHNISEVKNVLESEDVFSCIACLRKLGVKIKKIKPKHYLIYGKGLGSFYAKKIQFWIVAIQALLRGCLLACSQPTLKFKLKLKVIIH